jgi:hypothetical protein
MLNISLEAIGKYEEKTSKLLITSRLEGDIIHSQVKSKTQLLTILFDVFTYY